MAMYFKTDKDGTTSVFPSKKQSVKKGTAKPFKPMSNKEWKEFLKRELEKSPLEHQKDVEEIKKIFR